MTDTARHLTVVSDWRNAVACRTVDPDLFWPEPGTSTELIQKAKAVCAGCPVKQQCLDEAYRTNEWDSIAGGYTGTEREQALSGNATNRFHARRLDNSDARKLAVQFGAEILRCLVKRRMSVEQVGERMNASPRAIYGAFRMLVPPPPGVERSLAPSSVERLLMFSELSLLSLARMERSHDSIAKTLGTAQTVVSAGLSVIEQRDRALGLIHRRDREAAMELCWAQETRIRREAGVGLTVDDIIDMAGTKILALHQSGMPLRTVALKLGLNRESVRKAHARLTKKTTGTKTLTKNEMGAAA